MSFMDVLTRSEPKQKENTPLVVNEWKLRRKERSTMKDSSAGSSKSLKKSPTSKGSRFSQLNNEIVQFQGMVRQLEPLVKSSGNTPEDQWKARILLRSAGEVDRDIGKNMRRHEQSVRKIHDPNVRASHQKLNRDYNRAHDSFVMFSIQYSKNQQEVIAQFRGDQGWLSPEEVQQKRLEKQEEDFFVRVMREREEEVKRMNQSMHQVNNIYSELGRIVESQQEHINQIEDNIKDGKDNTRAGLNQFQRKFLYCGAAPSADEERRDAPPKLITEEDFHWSLPFRTIGEDMKEVVQKDILGLGKDIISMTRSHHLLPARNVLRCGSEKVVVD